MELNFNAPRLGALTEGQTTLEALPYADGSGYEVKIGSLSDGLPDMEAGRIVIDQERGKAAFQPAPFAAFAAGPVVLRALAEMVEQAEQGAKA
ncbi:hypothetical protein [Glutamicibacter arilaitensis]|uniref:hypothetical protein n=1 Tax=Glutamicibacter arilaitensis TaxID=256701 RepID=UPI003F93EB40